MKTKTCLNCRIEKALKFFAINRGGIWVYADKCRPCRKETKKHYRVWKKLSPEEKEKRSMARRARLLNCPVIIPFYKSEIIRRDGLNCYLCGLLLTVKTATIDHVIPLARGGFHCPNNAKIACLKCNQKKNKKLLSEL